MTETNAQFLFTVDEPCNPFKVTTWLTCELKADAAAQTFTVTLQISYCMWNNPEHIVIFVKSKELK